MGGGIELTVGRFDPQVRWAVSTLKASEDFSLQSCLDEAFSTFLRRGPNYGTVQIQLRRGTCVFFNENTVHM